MIRRAMQRLFGPPAEARKVHGFLRPRTGPRLGRLRHPSGCRTSASSLATGATLCGLSRFEASRVCIAVSSVVTEQGESYESAKRKSWHAPSGEAHLGLSWSNKPGFARRGGCPPAGVLRNGERFVGHEPRSADDSLRERQAGV